jgi:hypothetical protein
MMMFQHTWIHSVSFNYPKNNETKLCTIMLQRRNITYKSLVRSLYSVSYMLKTLWKSNNKRIKDDVQYILLTNKTPSQSILQYLPLLAKSFAYYGKFYSHRNVSNVCVELQFCFMDSYWLTVCLMLLWQFYQTENEITTGV